MEFLSLFLNMMAVMYWLFRVIVMFFYSIDKPFMIQPIDPLFEVITLFVTLICVYMLFRRKQFFGVIYFSTYLAYLGTGILKYMQTNSLIDIFTCGVGILIAFLNFIDILLNQNRTGGTRNDKVDWFYATDDYTRQMDDRADKNQYKIK